MDTRAMWLLVMIQTIAPFSPTRALAATVEQMIAMALQSNAQVHAARARWNAAEHSIAQNYAPTDPTFTYGSFDSSTNAIDHASAHALQGSESFQFPGKGYLQAANAKRSAEIARLSYEAVVRDVRARVEVQYFQFAIDTALTNNASRTISDLERFRSAIAADSPAHFLAAISSDLADAKQRRRRFELAGAEDEIRLNQLLNRNPDEPLSVDTNLDLKPIRGRVDDLTEVAWSRRQEILELALKEENAETALTLARLEYAPDYSVGYSFNHYILQSDAPASNLTETHSVWISFNLPLFFWMKQNEDVKRARFDLEAAREDLSGIRNQTAGEVTILLRRARFDYDNVVIYRDEVVPQALKAFEGALVGDQQRWGRFVTLSGLRNQLNLARAGYLEAINSFFADRIALEQEIGQPLEQ